MKAIVDTDTCTGCGLCEEVCPEVFELGDDGVAVVKVNPVPAEDEKTCLEAEESCPPQAIRVEK